MAGVPYVDKLPEIERQRVLKALVEAGIAPDYRSIIRKLNLKCSHTALWRYHRDKVKPSLLRNLARIAPQQPSQDEQLTPTAIDSRIEEVREAQSLTKRVLTDDPIVAAAIAKRERMAAAIAETHKGKEWDAYTKLENADTKALELLGKATMHPGFTSAPSGSVTNNLVLVLPAGSIEQAGAVIDVEPESE